jgi:hypothetical protein
LPEENIKNCKNWCDKIEKSDLKFNLLNPQATLSTAFGFIFPLTVSNNGLLDFANESNRLL